MSNTETIPTIPTTPTEDGEVDVSPPPSPRSDFSGTERERRPERKVTTDPRTVPFTIGRGRENLKTKGKELKEQFGESVFIKFIHPRSHEWGFWKILSRNEEAMDTAEQWLRQKEAECITAIADGSYVPRSRTFAHHRNNGDDNRPRGDRAYLYPGGDRDDNRPRGDRDNYRPRGDRNDRRPGGDRNDRRPGGDRNDRRPGGDRNDSRRARDDRDDRDDYRRGNRTGYRPGGDRDNRRRRGDRPYDSRRARDDRDDRDDRGETNRGPRDSSDGEWQTVGRK